MGRRSFKTKFAKSHGINKIFLDVTERKTKSLFITLYVVLVYTKNKNLGTEKKTCSTHSFALRRFTMSELDDFCFSNKRGAIHLWHQNIFLIFSKFRYVVLNSSTRKGYHGLKLLKKYLKNAPNQADNFAIFQWCSWRKISFSVALPCQIYRLLVVSGNCYVVPTKIRIWGEGFFTL